MALDSLFQCRLQLEYLFIIDTLGADINECLEGIHECEQNCHNTPESYICTCEIGFTLDVNGRNCTDIDECALNTDGCAHSCQNTDGSYVCTCNGGYQLNLDGHSCDGGYLETTATNSYN